MNREGAARTYHMVSCFRAGCGMPQHILYLQDPADLAAFCAWGHPRGGWPCLLSLSLCIQLPWTCVDLTTPPVASTFLPDTAAHFVLLGCFALLSEACETA